MRMKGWPVLVLILGLAVAAWAAQQMTVQVKETKLRAKPSFLGATTATLAYGALVTVIEDKGVWLHVRDAQGHDGWLHSSALGQKKVTMQAGDKQVATGASSDELALAGKGFTADVEKEYKKETDLDYTWVDRMESWTVTPQQSEAFLAAGGITPREGARP